MICSASLSRVRISSMELPFSQNSKPSGISPENCNRNSHTSPSQLATSQQSWFHRSVEVEAGSPLSPCQDVVIASFPRLSLVNMVFLLDWALPKDPHGHPETITSTHQTCIMREGASTLHFLAQKYREVLLHKPSFGNSVNKEAAFACSPHTSLGARST